MQTNHTCEYNAVGSGAYTAMGCLTGFDILFGLESEEITPAEILLTALRAAEFNVPSVGGPFHVINTENDDIIFYDENLILTEEEGFNENS
jgi:hypothetical protein